MALRILAVNPGSTTTKIAVYQDTEAVFTETIYHKPEVLAQYPDVMDQYDLRKSVILKALKAKGEDISKYDAIVGRGGLCKPIPSGVYEVNEQMIEDLKTSVLGKHASSLAGIIAYELANDIGVRSFIVDPVVVDEMEPLARYSGWSVIKRKSLFHALNQKAAAKKAAAMLGYRYDQVNLVVAHMGGGITVGVHKKGRVIDVNNGLEEGPFAPERAGTLPIGDLIKICFSGKYTKQDMMKVMSGKGGMVSYLGTNDGHEVEKRIMSGDNHALEVFEAMAYQISKEIGACATVLCGDLDAVVLTGGLANSERFVNWIKSRTRFISPIIVLPGEYEMESLAHGAWLVLTGQEEAKVYAPMVDWHHLQGFE